MKTITSTLSLVIAATAIYSQAAEPQTPAPDAAPATSSATAPASPADTNQPPADATANPPAAPAADSTNAPPVEATNAVPGSVAAVAGNGDKALRLNFRNAPLESVLNYLSEAAGFVIVLEAEVKGKVDVWSNQPVSKEEAVELLDTMLNKNGYSAIRNGRTLTIVRREDAKKRDIPVDHGNNPETIEKSDQMVTQIIPVRYANAVQMTKDLEKLLPDYATLTANESGNALVLTDTKTDVRRMVEIVKALDTSISSISSIRVFPLRYADAKDLANEIKEIFPAPQSNNNNNRQGGNFGGPMAMFMNRFGGGRGGGGQAAAGDGSTGSSEAKAAASRVTAVADDRTNSLVVSAPDEVIPTIEQLVKEIDTNAQNITELRVFRLRNSDPQEIADELTSLFPDDSKTDTTRSQVQFGGGGFGRGRGQVATAASDSSSRARAKSKVVAVPDARTSSVIVSASNDLIEQIGQVIEQLDSNNARRETVRVFQIENADVTSVESVLRDMFNRNTTQSRNSSSSTISVLQSRQQAGINSLSTTTGSTGSSSSSRGGSSGALP